MTQQEYEQKKRECFVKFCKDNGIDQEVNISIFDAFDQIFDRAFALGKQEKEADTVIVDKEEYDKLCKRSRYIANWVPSFIVCPICGEYNPSGCICANCDNNKRLEQMKARIKSDGKIIEVREWRGASDVIYSSPDMNQFYQASDLDFNVNAEETVIQGWAIRDKCGSLWVCDICPSYREYNYWAIPIKANVIALPQTLLPDLTWDSEPIEVELIIKRKKND